MSKTISAGLITLTQDSNNLNIYEVTLNRNKLGIIKFINSSNDFMIISEESPMEGLLIKLKPSIHQLSYIAAQ